MVVRAVARASFRIMSGVAAGFFAMRDLRGWERLPETHGT
ncbi:hypothetical protein ASZ90_001181 [hydrocarbon metagenome]|uniref:Uncharacterized protein n=1 Tax=hydrocarbon metagenome TaxID=938273 RepID=A0A0W8G701_9ZZZZ